MNQGTSVNAELFGPAFFLSWVVLLFWPVTVGLAIWAVVDLARRPEATFTGVTMSKVGWLLLIVLGTVLCAVVGLVSSINYLAFVRPKLEQP